MLEADKIYNMDCLDGLGQLDSGCVDLVVTDPPYENVLISKKNDFMSNFRDKYFIELKNFNYNKFVFESKRVLKSNSHLYIFCANPEIFSWYKRFIYAGFKFMNLLIWVKNSQTFDLSCGYHYNNQHENCMFFCKGSRKLNSLGLSNVMFFDIYKGKYVHPTIKPLDMIKFLVNNSSNVGDLVLDPFMGSGTTAIASKSLGRHFVGFELSKYFFDIANNRIKNSGNDWFF